MLSDFYVGGRFGVGVAGRYRKRYKYSGNFNIRYDVLPFENAESGQITRRRTFIFNLNHQQDQAAHPTARFGGNINFQTSQAQNLIFNDTRVQQNTTRSNFNFTKTISGSIPGTFTAGLSHDQNNQSREITVNFPDINFQTQTIYPFRDNQGQERWFEKFQFRYRGEAKATFRGADTTFFSQDTWDQAEYGVRQRLDAGIAFPVAQFFTVTPNISYTEVSYGRRLLREFDGSDPNSIDIDSLINEDGELEFDTTDFGTIIDNIDPGLFGFRTFSASVRLETQAFGTIRFGDKFPIRGIRHVIKPSISLAYQPGYRDNDDYFRTVEDTTDITNFDTYSPFEGQIYGSPPNTERQLGINYSLVNLFEAKVWSKKDSTERLVKLFNNINVSGSYNFEADTDEGEFAFSPVRVSGNTRFFKGVTSLNLSATFDPYIRISDGGSGRGTRINTFAWDNRGAPLLLDNLTANFSTNLTVAKIRQLFQGEEEELVTDVQEEERQRQEQENTLFEETDLLSLFENFSIRHNFRFSLDRFADGSGGTNDTIRYENTVNSLELRGSFQLSENWQVNIGSIGYDFVSERITYPFLNLRRDLHCWEMSFSWAPVRNTFMFNIAVKPGTFDFIKIPYRRNQADGGNLFGT
ncbi:MAG: putative LPS assembly protein LptD [Bacteroidota bacterium]